MPLAIFLLALAPRLTDLGSRPFWYDEVLTAQRAALPVAGLIRDSLTSHHTPVYFLLVAPLAHLPDPQLWLRLPSAILGALNVMLVFLITARAGGVTAGIAAALVVGLSPTDIAYSQEARSYMLIIFFLLIALHALTGLARSGERAALPWRAGGLAWVWLQFIAGSAAAFCILADSLPWLLAAISTAIVMIARTRNRIGLVRNFLAAIAISLAPCLPFYLLILHLAPNNILTHIPAPTPALIWYDLESVYLMRVCDFLSSNFMAVPTPQALTLGIGAGLGIAFFGGIWRLRRNPLAAALLPAALALPVFSGIVSIWRPILVARYLLWSGPTFAIIAGIGIAAGLEKCSPRIRQSAIAAISLLLLINLMPFYRVETKPRWDIAAQIFATQAGANDVAYYSDRGATTTMRFYLPSKRQRYLLTNLAGSLPLAEQARAQGKRLWVFYGDGWNFKPWMSLTDFQATLAPLGTPSAEMHAGSRIVIWRYDP